MEQRFKIFSLAWLGIRKGRKGSRPGGGGRAGKGRQVAGRRQAGKAGRKATEGQETEREEKEFPIPFRRASKYPVVAEVKFFSKWQQKVKKK